VFNVMTITSEGRNKNDAVHTAVLLMTPHSKYGAAELSHYSDWATDWTVRGSNPDSSKKFFSTPKAQTSSGAHPASYLMTTEVLPRNEVAGA
jgi:hypothetical protein